MQAFFAALARKLLLFLFTTAPDSLGKLVVGLVRPILVAQGVDRAMVATAIQHIGEYLQGLALARTADEQLVAEGGADVARGILSYFGIAATEISDASLGKFLVASARYL